MGGKGHLQGASSGDVAYRDIQNGLRTMQSP
jgi:hypothetical protein